MQQLPVPAFIAEISGNHLGKAARAAALVDIAAVMGASAVKFQTYEPARLVGAKRVTLDDGPWKGRALLDLYQEAWTPKTWHADLFAQARSRGLVPFSSPFSPEDVDFLEGLKCPIYKIASFEITDLELIRYAAGTKKPLIISTGMATLAEIERAVDLALAHDAPHVTLLKCTSGYPTPIEEANLETVRDMVDYFTFESDDRISIGLSDHTLGTAAAVAAVALGATMVEKHLTILRADGGPDAGFSAEPHEFKRMVEDARLAHRAVGRIRYGPVPSEATQLKLRRALWVVADVKKGENFTAMNLRACRPGYGHELLPVELFRGRRAALEIPAGTLFDKSMAS